MKLKYKQRLLLYIFIIFAVFSIGIIIVEQSEERKHKTKALEEKLETLANIANSAILLYGNSSRTLDSLLITFPKNIRFTLLDIQGKVAYDNAIDNLAALDNHSTRPEIANARKTGEGVDIRQSNTNQHEYLYYAKRYSSYYIRVALPYDIQVQNLLKADNLFLYCTLTLLAAMLILISIVAGRFGKSIKQLRDFTMSIEQDDAASIVINFPQDELGEIGEKIAENYALLKKNKKEVVAQREKLLQHVHSSEEGLCFFSANKTVEFYNGLFIQDLNTITDEAGSNPSAIFTDLAFEKVARFVSEPNPPCNFFETQITKHGKHFALRVNIFDDKSFEVVINDITKQEKTRQLKQEMTGNIAHELRTPVTGIRGYLETILEQELAPEKQRYFISKAHKQVLALSELVQDMGLITKIEENPQAFHLEPVSISQLLQDLQTDMEVALQDKGMNMRWSISDNVVVQGNRSLLYSIFRNLTDNAIRYAGENTAIYISKYNEDKDFYYLSFSDNGTGIPDEHHLNRLFERFYRINEGRTRDSGGSGLGLSIVKNAIAFHKGNIVAKNVLSGGLEFLFKLPKAKSNEP